MGGVLALDYRPITFKDVVGQHHIKPILQAMIRSQNVPPALLFSGTRGTGKTSCARIFAAALNCENRDGEACGQCPPCVAIQNSASSSVLEIDAASSGGVEEVRKIRDLCMYSHESDWRVVLLDEAHSMSKEAYNALLKLLEEPPANTVVVLVTTEPDKILSTVESRTMPFEFRRIKNSDLVDRLRHIATAEKIEVDDSLLFELAKAAQGGLRDAVMSFDQVTRVGVSTADEYLEFFGIRDYSLPIMWAALRGDHAEGYRLVSEHFMCTGEMGGMVSNLTHLVSELLVIHSEGRPKDHAEEALAERVEMAQAVSTEALVQVIEILWELRNRTRNTENDHQSSMQMAFALIANVVRPAQDIQRPILPETAKESEQAESPKLSLADMAGLAKGR